MSKTDELKVAWRELGAQMTELIDASAALSSWHDVDRNRSGGSDRQDAINEEIGNEAKDGVWRAKRNVEMQMQLLSKIIASL
jgi:hypothetical protein